MVFLGFVYYYSYHGEELTIEEVSIIKFELESQPEIKYSVRDLSEKDLLKTFVDKRLSEELPSAALALFVDQGGNYVDGSLNRSDLKNSILFQMKL